MFNIQINSPVQGVCCDKISVTESLEIKIGLLNGHP